MSSTYTPHGYLDFEQLFSRISKLLHDDSELSLSYRSLVQKREKLVYSLGTSTPAYEYDIYDMSEENRNKLEALLQNPTAQLKTSFSITNHKLASNDWRKATPSENVLQFKECQGEKFVFIRQKDQEEVKLEKKFLNSLVLTTKFWKCIRDALSNKKIQSSIFYENRLFDILNTIWIDDSHWYRIIIDGCIYTSRSNINDGVIRTLNPGNIEGKVFFKEDNIVKYCFESHSKLIPENELLLELLERSRKGELKFRAAERLYLNAKISFPYTTKDERGNDRVIGKKDNKAALERDLAFFAQDQLKFKIVEPQKVKGPFNEDESLSEADIKSIATLLRDVIQQGK